MVVKNETEIRRTLTCERLGCETGALVTIRTPSNKSLLVCMICRTAHEIWRRMEREGKTEVSNPRMHYDVSINESRMMEE